MQANKETMKRHTQRYERTEIQSSRLHKHMVPFFITTPVLGEKHGRFFAALNENEQNPKTRSSAGLQEES